MTIVSVSSYKAQHVVALGLLIFLWRTFVATVEEASVAITGQTVLLLE